MLAAQMSSSMFSTKLGFAGRPVRELRSDDVSIWAVGGSCFRQHASRLAMTVQLRVVQRGAAPAVFRSKLCSAGATAFDEELHNFDLPLGGGKMKRRPQIIVPRS